MVDWTGDCSETSLALKMVAAKVSLMVRLKVEHWVVKTVSILVAPWVRMMAIALGLLEVAVTAQMTVHFAVEWLALMRASQMVASTVGWMDCMKGLPLVGETELIVVSAMGL